MNLSCLIVEDEPFAQKGMEEFVNNIHFLKLAGICDDAMDALTILGNQKIDLLFLDIHMPKLNGLNFLESLPDQPLVILTTAYPEYALEGYDYNVIDYLVKPIAFERFVKAVNKAKSHFSVPTIQLESDFFFIKTNKKLEKIAFAELLYVEALSHYIALHTVSKKYITHLSIGGILEKLPPSFVKVHKSFVVPIDKIESIDADSVFIGGMQIPVSKNYRSDLMAVINSKLFNK